MRKRGTMFLLAGAFVALAMCSMAIAHPGGITTPDPDLPPEGVYLSPSDVHAMYSGPALAIVLSKPQHMPFQGFPPQYFSDPVRGPVEQHHFESEMQGQAQCLGANCALIGVPDGGSFPIMASGPVDTIAYPKGPTDTTGVFETEMLSMNLVGMSGAVMIRESPTLPSLGMTSITDVGGGLYHIDSFFDVFTELSLDGGATWIPNSAPNPYGPPGSTRVVLGIPEPASVALSVLGVLGLAGLICRRRGCTC